VDDKGVRGGGEQAVRALGGVARVIRPGGERRGRCEGGFRPGGAARRGVRFGAAAEARAVAAGGDPAGDPGEAVAGEPGGGGGDGPVLMRDVVFWGGDRRALACWRRHSSR